MVIYDWTKYYSSLAPVIKAPYSLQWVDGVIEDGGILENLIGDGAVSTTKIQDAAITNAKISNISADKIITSTLTAQVNVGSGTGYVRLDGVNNRIIIHDGSHPRIVIGNV